MRYTLSACKPSPDIWSIKMPNNSILLVDHDPFSATEIYIALEDMGYSVFGPVGSEGEALKAWHDGEPKAVIINTDTVNLMPELLSVLRKSDIPTAVFGDRPALVQGSIILNTRNIQKSLAEFLIDPGLAHEMIIAPEALEEMTAHTVI